MVAGAVYTDECIDAKPSSFRNDVCISQHVSGGMICKDRNSLLCSFTAPKLCRPTSVYGLTNPWIRLLNWECITDRSLRPFMNMYNT
eukprot:scaffold159965_cov17-Prasinocladus_malaysianus.AAC.1